MLPEEAAALDRGGSGEEDEDAAGADGLQAQVIRGDDISLKQNAPDVPTIFPPSASASEKSSSGN
jgi:hypothetical protein